MNGLMLASVCLGVAALTRPEGSLVFVTVLAIEVFLFRKKHSRQELRNLCAYSVPFLLISLPFLMWRLHFYGFLFPNTYYAKHSGNRLNNLPLGLLYLGNAFASYLTVPLSLILGVLFSKQAGAPITEKALEIGLSKEHQVVLPLALVVCVYAAYIFWVGGDDTAAFPSVRLLAPVLPILWLALIALWENATTGIKVSRRVAAAVVMVILCTLAWSADGLALLIKNKYAPGRTCVFIRRS